MPCPQWRESRRLGFYQVHSRHLPAGVGLAGGLHPGGLADFPPGLGVAGGERARGGGRPPAEDDEALKFDDADAVWGVVAVCNSQYLGGDDP